MEIVNEPYEQVAAELNVLGTAFGQILKQFEATAGKCAYNVCGNCVKDGQGQCAMLLCPYVLTTVIMAGGF